MIQFPARVFGLLLDLLPGALVAVGRDEYPAAAQQIVAAMGDVVQDVVGHCIYASRQCRAHERAGRIFKPGAGKTTEK